LGLKKILIKPFIFESQNFPTRLFQESTKNKITGLQNNVAISFLGGYEEIHPKLQTFQKIVPKKLVGTKTLHEEKLYDLYRPLSAFSTIVHFVSLLQAENEGKLSVRSRLAGNHETRMFTALFTKARLLSY
jgi:hypothetical protein